MKKFILFAAVAMIASTSFAQVGAIRMQQQTAVSARSQKERVVPLKPNTVLGAGETKADLKAVNVPICFKYSVTPAQIAAIGAATSGNILLTTLPAKAVILTTTIKHSAAVAGTSITAATARVITANHNYGTAFDVFQAPGNTVLDFDGTPFSENFAATTPVNLAMTSTGGNLSAVTAGTIDVWITYLVRP